VIFTQQCEYLIAKQEARLLIVLHGDLMFIIIFVCVCVCVCV